MIKQRHCQSKFSSFLFAVMLISFFSPAALPKETTYGVVLDEVGIWKIVDGKRVQEITEGDSIPEGFTLKQPSVGSTISILRRNGSILNCPDEAQSCRCVLKNDPNGSFIDGLWTFTFRLFEEHPDRYVTTLSRSDKVGLNDGIAIVDEHSVLFKGQRIDGPVLKLKSLDNRARVWTAKVSNSNENDTFAQVQGMVPGLYLVTIDDGSEIPDSKAALLMAVNVGEFNTANEQMRSVEQKLGGDVSNYTQSRRQIYRAALDATLKTFTTRL